MMEALFDEAFDEFEKEIDPVDSAFDEALEEFDVELEVGGELDDEDDGYFSTHTAEIDDKTSQNTDNPTNTSVDKNNLKEETLPIKSIKLEKLSPIDETADYSNGDNKASTLTPDQMRMWNHSARSMKRNERKSKRGVERERKHRIYEMAQSQAVEMKSKLMEASNANPDQFLLELNMLSAEVDAF
jgi:hypothetical protein